MNVITIHTYDKQWKNATLVGVGKDTLTGIQDVVIVHHPDFKHDTEFYAQPDEQGRRPNVGNAAYWITEG